MKTHGEGGAPANTAAGGARPSLYHPATDGGVPPPPPVTPTHHPLLVKVAHELEGGGGGVRKPGEGNV